MATWKERRYSDDEVARAGERLMSEGLDAAVASGDLAIIDNWRMCHAFPLNTFQVRLRQIAARVNRDANVVQRHKRLASIWAKLERFGKSGKVLRGILDIQDIGGCRAIMPTIDDVRAVQSQYEKSKARRMQVDEDDYISNPKGTGYRGVHLMFKYAGKRAEYHGMRIEIQIRTQLQHAWATAVETVDAFTGQGLKAGQGAAEWRRFFRLMSAVFALREGTTPVPKAPVSLEELRAELVPLEQLLQVRNILKRAKETMRVSATLGGNQSWFLLKAVGQDLEVTGFASRERAEAQQKLLLTESETASVSVDVVLVRASSIEALQRAYPNYYADTDRFLEALEAALS